MKRHALFLALVLTVFCGLASAQAALSPVIQQSTIDVFLNKIGDDPFPWPWGSESEFPWQFIEGHWLLEKGNQQSYFSFQVQHDGRGATRLLVQQRNPANCQVIAAGYGYLSGRAIWAQMDTVWGEHYYASVRAFPQGTVRGLPSDRRNFQGQQVMLSLFHAVRMGEAHLPIFRLSPNFHEKCVPKRTTSAP